MCRGAKEMLLAHGAPEAAPIRLVESGSQLVGTALSCELGRDEVREVVLDGFFPLVARDDASVARRGGLRAFGLPYERDVAITRHLAAFVRRHAGDEPIAAVLLNGGVFEAKLVAERIVEVLAGWAQASGRQVVSVPLHDPNLSVALGAVAYGRALAGRGVTIGGGSARGYYLGLSGSEQLVSILPRGSEEGVTTRAGERRFLLRVGEPARFEVLAADDGHDGAGAMVTRDPERHQLLPPLVATLPGDKGTREVGLEASLSAIGTLDVACVAGGDHAERYALEFELRSTSTTGAPHTARLQSAPADRYGKRLDEARGAIDAVLGKAATEVASRDIKGLTRALEKILGKRERWALDLNRALFDALFRHYKRRRRSAEHERTFWSLAGYTLRPGVGHPKDDERVRGLQRLFAARLAHPGELRSWQQYWIAWRRIAAGLDEGMQGEIFAAIAPWVAPAEAELKKSKGFRNDAQFEMLDLAACLECLPAGQRAELGGWILERTWTSRDARLWAALGRVGARTPTYASLHHVVATRTVERWLDHLLREKWQQLPTAARAATAMARMTNDRGRDISDGLRKRVLDRFTKLAIDEQLRKPIDQLVQFDDADRSAFYGADLPAGLALAESSPAGDARSVDPQR